MTKLNYDMPVDPKYARKVFRWIVIVLIAPVVACVLIGLCGWFPDHPSPYPQLNRDKCADNLRQIGEAIREYSESHGGEYPDSLGTLLPTENVHLYQFVCPASNVMASDKPTTQAQSDDINSGRNGSYLYLGKGMNARNISPTTVIVYEPLLDHGDGMNVLFGDGRVQFIPVGKARTILEQLSAGKSRVYFPATQPTD